MKHAKTIVAAATVALALAMPSISRAQYPDQRLDQFLAHHPNVRADLQRNPNLIFDRRFRSQHVELEEFMQQHPNIWGKLPNANRWGGYGPDHNWHEADWWHEHDRDWFYRNHPEWAENHPEWRDEGDFDEHHEWHARDWWNDHRPDWVREHHPNWYKHPENQAAEEHEYHEQGAQPQAHGNKHDHHGNKPDHDHN